MRRVVYALFLRSFQELYDLVVFYLREMLIVDADRNKRGRHVEDLKVVDQRSYVIDGLSRSHGYAANQTVNPKDTKAMNGGDERGSGGDAVINENHGVLL